MILWTILWVSSLLSLSSLLSSSSLLSLLLLLDDIYTNIPLWYPRYDGYNNMSFFSSFANWDSVYIKQTNGDVNYCNITQVDSDYMDDNDDDNKYINL